MHVNPTYELAFEGVAPEVNMNLNGDMISRSIPVETPDTVLNESMGTCLPEVAEEDGEEYPPDLFVI